MIDFLAHASGQPTPFTVYKNAALKNGMEGATTMPIDFANSPLFFEDGKVKSPD